MPLRTVEDYHRINHLVRSFLGRRGHRTTASYPHVTDEHLTKAAEKAN